MGVGVGVGVAVGSGVGVAVGVGIGIETGFQPGGRLLREKGVKLKSLAVVEKIEDGKIFLAPDDD